MPRFTVDDPVLAVILLLVLGVGAYIVTRKFVAWQILEYRQNKFERQEKRAGRQVTQEQLDDRSLVPKPSGRRITAFAVPTYLVGVLLFQLCVFSARSDSDQAPASSAQVAALMGMENPKVYPITLGKGTAPGGTVVLSQAKPRDDVWVRFVREDLSPLEVRIPFARINFRSSDTETPSLRLQFDARAEGGYYSDLVRAEYGSCRIVVNNLVADCERDVLSRTFKNSRSHSYALRQVIGLGSTGIDVVLPPDVYERMTGAISVEK